MAAIQYLIPGGSYVNEDTDQREFLIPGGSYLNETSAGATGGFARIVGGGVGGFTLATTGGGLAG